MDHTNTYTSSVEEPSTVRHFSLRETGDVSSPVSSRFSWLVLALITLVYVGTCFAPVIFDDNEGLYAGAVREMHQSGNWLMPTVNGFPRVQKPPLVYWTMLVSTSIFGESEFALRLPNALATAGWIIATYLIMRRLGGERFGLASACVLASMLGVWVFNHLVQPEPFLACFISLSIWCLVEARCSARPEALLRRRTFFGERFAGDNWYFLFWTFLALGAMSKGLHGALWPLGTALLAAVFVPMWRALLRPIFSLRGLLVFVAIVAPWYIYMAAHLPGFLSAHFVNEQIGASLNTRYPADAKQLPLAQFYLQHFLFWLPWTLLLPGAIYAAVKARGLKTLTPEVRDMIKLLVCFFLLVQVSVAFSTRQDYYSMCSWGVMAAFFAMPWILDAGSTIRMPRTFLVVPSALILGAGVLALGFTAWITPKLGALGAATASPIRERDTFMDAIAGISPGLWGKFVALLAIFGAAMLIGGGIATALTWRRRAYPALLVLAGAMTVPIGLATAGFTMMSPYFSLAEEARAINCELTPESVVACEALPHTASSLYCYLNTRVHWVNAPFNQQYPQRVLGLGHDYYWDETGLQKAWASPHPVYLIIEQSRFDYWHGLLPPGARVVDKAGTRMVLCNR